MLNPEKFRSIYADYIESGLTIRAFCANHSMNEAKFYYWQHKLKNQLPIKDGFVPVILGRENCTYAVLPEKSSALQSHYGDPGHAPGTGCPGDDYILSALDKIKQRQAFKGVFIKGTIGRVIDILYRGRVPEVGRGDKFAC